MPRAALLYAALFFLAVLACACAARDDDQGSDDSADGASGTDDDLHSLDDDHPQPPSYCKFVASMGSGYREDCGGVTVLHVKGTPYDLGYQTGALMRGEITDLIFLIRTYLDPFGFAWSVFQDAERIIENEIRPEFIEEMRGLTDGLNNDVTYEEILTGNCLGDIFGAIRAFMDNYLDLDFCSLTASWGDATADGEMIVTRNFDYMNIFSRYNYVAVVRPDRGHAFVTTGIAGLIGIHAGMNDTGLTGALAYNSSWDSDMSGVPMLLLLREAVQFRDSVEGAEQVIVSADRTMGLNYMFTDAFEWKARVLETSGREWAVREDEGGNYLITTNHYVHPDMVGEQRGYEPTHTSMVRYRRLTDLIEQYYGEIDLRTAGTIMRDHYDMVEDAVKPSRVTLCRHDDLDYREGSLMNQFVSTTTPSILMKPVDGDYCTTVSRHACDGPYFCFKPFD